jgi:hypothetical protein
MSAARPPEGPTPRVSESGEPKTSAETSAAVRVPKHGSGRLRNGGKPGNKGGGRKPLEYKRWLASLLDSAKHRDEFKLAMESRADPRFEFATRHATEYGHGKPAQQLNVNATVQVIWDLQPPRGRQSAPPEGRGHGRC